jgi:hypothetical protein
MIIRQTVVACFIGLMPAVGLAQHDDEKLVTVETLPPEPTVIMSGDLVKITYRVRFPELVDAGQEIIILEDRTTPEKLSVLPFEGVGLQIDKRALGGGHVWDFGYSLRLIHRDKSTYTIPPISFYWLVRDFGEAVEKAEVRQVETSPAPVRYVTTVTESGPLDIRDTIDLGRYAKLAAAWTTVAWIASLLPLVLWIVYVAKLSRRPRPVTVNERSVEELDQITSRLPVPPSVGAARRQLRRAIRRLRDAAPAEDGRGLHALERDLVITTRDYLHAELPALNPGDTAKEIKHHVETRLPPGRRQKALLALAARLVVYQRSLEQGPPEPISDPSEEARALDASLDQLLPHVRMWQQVRDGLKRGG